MSSPQSLQLRAADPVRDSQSTFLESDFNLCPSASLTDEWRESDYLADAWYSEFRVIYQPRHKPTLLFFETGTQNTRIQKVRNLAYEVMHKETADRWMCRPNQSLDGQTPFELLSAGKQERVEALLLALADGVTS